MRNNRFSGLSKIGILSSFIREFSLRGCRSRSREEGDGAPVGGCGGGCLASWDRRAASLPRRIVTEKERATERTCERKRKRWREGAREIERKREKVRTREIRGGEREVAIG